MDYFDALETRDPLAREAQLFRQLPEVIAAAVATCPYYRELLADLTPGEVDARGKLAALPITRKEALIDRQVVQPPLGGLVGDDWGGIDSLF
ncbi:MAG: phenylacetate--CoA ligase family protein, partial [Candidatus Competibacterales bacterium]